MARIAPGVIPIKNQNPYETVRVIASPDRPVNMNDIVCSAGYTGDVIIVEPASAHSLEHKDTVLFIAMTDAAPGRALWVQPWRVSTKVETDWSPIHTPVYLGHNGKFVLEIPTDDTMWYKRRIGTVIDKDVIHFHLR